LLKIKCFFFFIIIIFLFGFFSDVGNVRGNEFAFMACWVVEKVKEFKKGKEKM